jgi:FkbM family methyltransferase
MAVTGGAAVDLFYAQNLEDYHLAQAFQVQADGFYVDLGAGHPVADNVSFWFYLRGWRGLVVEPQRRLADLYPHVRPRDRVVAALVADRVGEAEFHEVESMHGFSTMLPDAAQAARDLGATIATVTLPVTTLAALFAEHGVERIDFLKIDVEGAEAQVLAGADWGRWRPRIVVLEAVAPGSMAPAWETWDPLLTRNGYRFGLFDGLNRFYVAEEEPELAARLPKEKADWGSVPHLWGAGRAPESPPHPDHALARALVDGFLARLPVLDRDLVADFLAAGGAVDPAEARAQVRSDAVAAALGRIASRYDGGFPPD